LQSPGAEFLRARTPPLIERHPVRFWQGLAALLGLAVVGLLALRALGP